MADADDERELRLLLERAVPRLPAPDGRMRRIRDRVERRRRVRAGAAALGIAAATVAVAATGQVAGLRWGQLPEPVPPTGQHPPAATAASPAGKPVRYPDLYGMSLLLPPGWTSWSDPRSPESYGFAANQPMKPPVRCLGSTAGGDACPPLTALEDGGVLVTFQVVGKEPAASDDTGPTPFDGTAPTVGVDTTPEAESEAESEATVPPLTLGAAPMEPPCRDIGGLEQREGRRTTVVDGTWVTVAVSVCLREPSDQALRELATLVDSIRFGPAPAPSHGADSTLAPPPGAAPTTD
ncbi:hypothetical protein [Allostreptomyces psammosilenae]|uniref:Uncharacterized protein n=1 Tax=Allostreptomyces psammosilenae TaxID=1892865 RepID=A0A853A598_9ACTN|nr:hypothetical protein [Allostreptomyces psammosilenae]NYI05871.1 hypothetical protein [Allostreptomyces psammosilenae]